MTTKTQSVIHIDTNNQRIRIVRIPAHNNLPDLQRLVGGYICTACHMEGDHTLFVDDEGLFKPQAWFFRLRGQDRPLAGNGVIVGPERYDGNGDYLGTEDVAPWLLPAVRTVVEFLTREQIDAWAKANASDPEISFTNLDTGETEVIAYRGKVWGDMPKPDTKKE